MNLTITHEIPRAIIGTILEGAVHGGITDWAGVSAAEIDSDDTISRAVIYDLDNPDTPYTLDHATIALGMQRVIDAPAEECPEITRHAVREAVLDQDTSYIDGTDADVVVQFAIWGKILVEK